MPPLRTKHRSDQSATGSPKWASPALRQLLTNWMGGTWGGQVLPGCFAPSSEPVKGPY